MPSLSDLGDGEARMTTNFRRVYATVRQDWLGLATPDIVRFKMLTRDRVDPWLCPSRLRLRPVVPGMADGLSAWNALGLEKERPTA
jgi:hypothetical protein